MPSGEARHSDCRQARQGTAIAVWRGTAPAVAVWRGTESAIAARHIIAIAVCRRHSTRKRPA
ncbi:MULTISPECIES: hypothetical protein [Paenibacillus]|uniref:hypothetical protein n=1 Tax=Paenibacillus TaxID=44249 RepID=UPI0011A84E2A|nr:hypothetical protein [Paenibacillus sp. IHBB 10380]